MVQGYACGDSSAACIHRWPTLNFSHSYSDSSVPTQISFPGPPTSPNTCFSFSILPQQDPRMGTQPGSSRQWMLLLLVNRRWWVSSFLSFRWTILKVPSHFSGVPAERRPCCPQLWPWEFILIFVFPTSLSHSRSTLFCFLRSSPKIKHFHLGAGPCVYLAQLLGESKLVLVDSFLFYLFY